MGDFVDYVALANFTATVSALAAVRLVGLSIIKMLNSDV